MDLTPAELLQVALDSVDEGDMLPAGLHDRVVAAAAATGVRRRHPGWDGEPGPINPLDAFAQTAAELSELLDGLTPEQWDLPALGGRETVRAVAEHLVGVERYILGCLGPRPPLAAPQRSDHWPTAREAAGDIIGQAPALVTRAWWCEVLAVVEAASTMDPLESVAFLDLVGTVRGLLIVRTFELWTHGNDVREGIERPLDRLDAARMGMMVGELLDVLPWGLALRGVAQPGRSARLTVTGPGGGRFDVALSPGEPVGAPDIAITTDAFDLCRLAANRMAPDELAVVVDGDAALLEPILVGAGAFAAD